MMNNDFAIRTIKAVTIAYPAVVPFLRGNAARIYCEHKAVERDPEEPGKEKKDKFETRLRRMMLKRLQSQFEKIKERLNDQYGKAITVDGMVLDEGDDAELVALIMAGLISGVDLTESEIGIYLADGSVNARALVTARNYVTEWLQQLDQTSERAVRDALETFITQPGATVGDMVDILQPVFGDTRAWRIAVTETTRVYSLANDLYADEMQNQYPEMQVVKQWWTNSDDRVCPICGPLHGKIAARGETFPRVAW